MSPPVHRHLTRLALSHCFRYGDTSSSDSELIELNATPCSGNTGIHTEHRKDPRYEKWRYRIFVLTWLGYAGLYLTRKSFSVAKIPLKDPDIMGLTNAQLSMIDFYYLTAYAVGQFLWGMAGDRFGTRKVILTGMLISILVAVCMGASTLISLFCVLMMIQGLCQATGWGPLAKNMSEFFSQRERGRAMGLWMTNYAIGGFAASALAGWAAQSFGWRFAFWVPAAGLFGIWMLFLLFQQNRPEDVGLPSVEEYHGEAMAVLEPGERPEEEPEGSWKVICEVMTNRMVQLLSVVYFFLKPTRYLILFWSPVYLNMKLGTGEAASGILGSMFDLAGPISVYFGGLMSDRVFKTKRMPMCVMALLAVSILLFCFEHLPATRLALGAGFFAIGFLLYIPDSLVSGTAAVDFGTRKGASTAAGMVNGFGSIGAIVGGTMPGWVGKLMGPDVYIWGYIFTGLGFSLLVAGLLLLPQWNRLPVTVSET